MTREEFLRIEDPYELMDFLEYNDLYEVRDNLNWHYGSDLVDYLCDDVKSFIDRNGYNELLDVIEYSSRVESDELYEYKDELDYVLVDKYIVRDAVSDIEGDVEECFDDYEEETNQENEQEENEEEYDEIPYTTISWNALMEEAARFEVDTTEEEKDVSEEHSVDSSEEELIENDEEDGDLSIDYKSMFFF